MKKLYFILFFIALTTTTAWSQTGTAINTTGNAPDPSAILDVQSTTQGVLIPRLLKAQRQSMSSPADGLMIYQTDAPIGLYMFQSGAWRKGNTQWKNYRDTSTSIIYFNEVNSRVGIGVDSPVTYLDVAGSVRIGANEFATSANRPPVNGLLVGGPVGINTDVTNPSLLTIGGVGSLAAIGIGNNHYLLAKNYIGIYENYLVPRTASNQLLMTYGTGGMNVQNTQSVSALYIKNSGEVGLANVNPVYKLDVTGDINFTSKIKFGAKDVIYNNSNDVYGNFRVIQNMSPTISDGLWLNYGSAGGANAHLRLYAGTTASTRLFIRATDGFIGIGTESPANLLTVNGTGNINALAINRTTLNPNNNFSVTGNGDFSGKLSVGIAAARGLNIFSVAGGADVSSLAINSGSGNPDNGYKLSVTGNSDFNGMVAVGKTSASSTLDIETGSSQVKINGVASGQGDENTSSYPLAISGANQGISVKLNVGRVDNSNNFILFSDNTGSRGRIEGNTVQEVASDPVFILDNINDGVGIAIYLISTICDLVGLDDFDQAIPDAAQAIVVAINGTARNDIDLTRAGVDFESGGADYAEWLKRADSNEEIKAGEIVGVVNGEISKKTESAQQIMVISSNPAVVGNMPESGQEKNYEKVAFMGQVLTRVKGIVNSGDFIVASGNNDGTGIAKSAKNMTTADYLNIVGTAWKSSTNTDVKFINVLVGMNSNTVTAKLVDQQNQLTAMQSRLDEMDHFLKAKFNDYKTDEAISTIASKPVTSAQVAKEKGAFTPEVVAKLKATSTKPDYNHLKSELKKNPEVMEFMLKTVRDHCKSVGLDPDKNPEVAKLITPNFMYDKLDKLSAE